MHQPRGDYDDDYADASTWPSFEEWEREQREPVQYSNEGVTQADVDKLFRRASSSYVSVGGPKSLKHDRQQKQQGTGVTQLEIDELWQRSRANKGVKMK